MCQFCRTFTISTQLEYTRINSSSNTYLMIQRIANSGIYERNVHVLRFQFLFSFTLIALRFKTITMLVSKLSFKRLDSFVFVYGIRLIQPRHRIVYRSSHKCIHTQTSEARTKSRSAIESLAIVVASNICACQSSEFDRTRS